MPNQAVAYLLALIVAAVVVAGVAFAVTTGPDGSGLVAATPGHRGEEVYLVKAPPPGSDGPLAGCVACHSVEKNGPHRYAPNLYGIVDANKARAGWYGYSQALASAGGSWSEKDLDAYLAKPSKFLPGTSKTIVGIADAERRRAIIDALK